MLFDVDYFVLTTVTLSSLEIAPYAMQRYETAQSGNEQLKKEREINRDIGTFLSCADCRVMGAAFSHDALQRPGSRPATEKNVRSGAFRENFYCFLIFSIRASAL